MDNNVLAEKIAESLSVKVLNEVLTKDLEVEEIEEVYYRDEALGGKVIVEVVEKGEVRTIIYDVRKVVHDLKRYLIEEHDLEARTSLLGVVSLYEVKSGNFKGNFGEKSVTPHEAHEMIALLEMLNLKYVGRGESPVSIPLDEMAYIEGETK